MVGPRQFALKTLERIMNEGWEQDRGLAHVIAYSENAAEKRYVAGRA